MVVIDRFHCMCKRLQFHQQPWYGLYRINGPVFTTKRHYNTMCHLSAAKWYSKYHYDDVIMGAMASQITSLTIVYSTVYSGADQSKHQSSASLAFCVGNSPVTGEFPAQMASYAENVSICHFVHTLLWKLIHKKGIPKPVKRYICIETTPSFEKNNEKYE